MFPMKMARKFLLLLIRVVTGLCRKSDPLVLLRRTRIDECAGSIRKQTLALLCAY